MVKPGSKDRKAIILITGLELDELQCFTDSMAESFGLDRRMENYQGFARLCYGDGTLNA